MKETTIGLIEKEKIIVIVRGVEKEKLIPFAEAMYRGGIRLIECTFDASGKTSDEECGENIKMLSEHFGDKMSVGAGTVLTEKQVEITKASGGKFIISPDTNPDVIKKTNELELVSMPGAFTPTEIVLAHRCGADFVKVFPVGRMGPKYLSDIKAPLSHIKLLAVGGIDADNMCEYLKAGACGIGVGSGIVNKKLIAEGNFEKITMLAKDFCDRLDK